MARPQRVMTAEEMARTLTRMAHQILEAAAGGPEIAFVGVHTRGAPLASRLADRIAAAGAPRPPVGMLDINLYRDDLTRVSAAPLLRATSIPFDIDRRTVVLVDDVLHTGRTVRAALDALSDFGRPARVQLAAFIERSGRELPIQPDVVGRRIEAPAGCVVEVHLTEIDGVVDEVVVIQPTTPSRRNAPPAGKPAAALRRKARPKRGRR